MTYNAQPFRLAVLLEGKDAHHHYNHALVIKEQHNLAYYIRAMMEIALPHLLKQQLVLVSSNIVLMLYSQLILNANPSHISVLQMAQAAYYLEVVKLWKNFWAAKDQAHVIQDRYVWIDPLASVTPHNHYAY